MPEIRDIIARLRAGATKREIKRETGTHRKIIRRVEGICRAHGLLDPDKPIPAEAELLCLFQAPVVAPAPHALDPCELDLKRWHVEDGLTVAVIQRLLKDRGLEVHRSSLWRYLRRKFPATPPLTMRRMHLPGEVMEVDFRDAGLVYDVKEARLRRAWIFSARLRYSRKAYRTVVCSQEQETFFLCHMEAFEYFGGVPGKVVLDNLKAGIIRACWVEPLENRAYRRLAEDYGFLISACPPRQPNKKGGVESDMGYLLTNFLPYHREKLREAGKQHATLIEMRRALAAWGETVAHVRIVQGVGATPNDLFEEEVKHLRPLPQFRPLLWRFKLCRTGEDFRVQFEKAFYSVPHQQAHRDVLVAANSERLEVYYEERLIALHSRATRKWEFVFSREHFPPHYQDFLDQTCEGIREKAVKAGASVARLIEGLLTQRGVDGKNPARGVLRLAEKFGASRLETACRRALDYGTTTYRSVKDILEKNLDEGYDKEPRLANVAPALAKTFRYARPPRYYSRLSGIPVLAQEDPMPLP